MDYIKPEDRILDWESFHDERSLSYGIRPLLASKVDQRPQFWKEGIVLDQGQEGACVGFGWTAELLAEPFAPPSQPPLKMATAMAHRFYKMAQKVDQWPGEDYEGTSVIAGAKIIKQEGFMGGYRWCFGIEDLRDAIISEGPVVIGIPWHQGMYHTRKSGLVEVSGKQVGGHCLTVTGYDPEMEIEGQKREVFRWRNSWGSSYGLDGSGYVEYNVLRDLLKQNAEACIPVDRKNTITK
jgi:hypothetical protein